MKRFNMYVLFISSYIPLFITLVIFNLDINRTILFIKNIFTLKIKLKSLLLNLTIGDIYFWWLIIISIVVLMYIYFLINKSEGYKDSIKIDEIDNENGTILEYIMTYLLSFSSSNFSDFTQINIQTIITFWLILSLIGNLYVKNNMLYVNPTLHIFFKYNIYKVKSNEENYFILSKQDKYTFNKNLNKQVNASIFSEDADKKIYILK